MTTIEQAREVSARLHLGASIANDRNIDKDFAILAKAAGTAVAFGPVALAEFVRLVRESVFAEAAAQCRQLADCEENTEGYRNGAAWCAERIKGMK